MRAEFVCAPPGSVQTASHDALPRRKFLDPEARSRLSYVKEFLCALGCSRSPSGGLGRSAPLAASAATLGRRAARESRGRAAPPGGV